MDPYQIITWLHLKVAAVRAIRIYRISRVDRQGGSKEEIGTASMIRLARDFDPAIERMNVKESTTKANSRQKNLQGRMALPTRINVSLSEPIERLDYQKDRCAILRKAGNYFYWETARLFKG